ncbi:helix-turn-helix domain-containing protein [Azospirillum doebereinerae]|uniref:helix-turn-helix domain-containing protein n=1 Tax=Azospirillum doebereinerae TaxID=92933 RepID=UPI001EE5FEE4|nr:helix-turn-helix transcriptional regulator [Azospirillum doebereinerae]MCG5241968.1 helix-turn-helix domain-containing protein [Azospirillum doebereinerae]
MLTWGDLDETEKFLYEHNTFTDRDYLPGVLDFGGYCRAVRALIAEFGGDEGIRPVASERRLLRMYRRYWEYEASAQDGLWLTQWRARMGWTQERAAAELRVSLRQYKRLESSSRGTAPTGATVRLAISLEAAQQSAP